MSQMIIKIKRTVNYLELMLEWKVSFFKQIKIAVEKASKGSLVLTHLIEVVASFFQQETLPHKFD